MKIKTKLFGALATLALLLPLGLGSSQVAKADETSTTDDTQTVVLHKLQYTSLPSENIDNTGDPITNLPSDSKPLKGVKFVAYDVTKQYYELRNGNETVPKLNAEDAYAKLQTTNIKDISGLEFMKEFSVTDDRGEAFADLPLKSEYTINSKKQDAIYLIVENYAPSNVNQAKSANMVLALPVYNEDGTTKKETVHLYPKNEVYGKELSFTKYGVKDGKNKPLAGAKFRLKDSNGSYLQEQHDSNGFPSFSDVSKAKIFVSNDEGVVSTDGYNLSPGTYTFEEYADENGITVTDDSGTYHASKNATSIVTATVVDNSGTLSVGYDYYNADGSPAEGAPASAYNYATPTPEKSVDDIDVDYTQVLNYTAKLTIPDDISISEYTKFDLVDRPDDDLNVKTDTVIAKLNDTALETKAVKEGNGFRLSFFNSEPDKATIKANAGKTIEVTYKMSVIPGADLQTDITNDITFDNNFHPETSTKVIVKSYGKKFVKKDANTEKTLKGANFVVKNSKDKFAEFDEYSNFVGWVDKATENSTITSGTDGSFEVRGLATGQYTLVETKAPVGYHLPSDPTFSFEVSETSYSNEKEILDVPNTQSGVLPSTGGKGIYAFIAIGTIAVAGAVFYFTRGRKQTEA
ncbi:cell wall surface anchor protein [Enterococcus saigonensis]|uniref:Cell wall surface anchor protein n=1 Tax=Enterococcus saigonensis TaxID=1805431 RepID=A0A679IDI2_9ENTE|nr:SpaH/EbpB family LPXTG-anchored major pilin [Enterococcus saigonensis]BCA86380.1 cell wall surface anchor protein [Enterococcus saigonensis]